MLTHAIQASEQVTPTIVREDDTRQHIEDTPLFTVIRQQRFIELPWNELTEAERRAIHVNLFRPCELY